jgi:hypothetical protein
MFETSILLTERNSSSLKLARILVLGSRKRIIAEAAWNYSRTLLSWYRIASSDIELISKRLVRPVCPTSWHKADKMKENIVNSSKSLAFSVLSVAYISTCALYITSNII